MPDIKTQQHPEGKQKIINPHESKRINAIQNTTFK